MSSAKLQPVEMILALHPTNYAALQKASRAAGLSEADFCVLAIHRESLSTLTTTATQAVAIPDHV